MSPPLLRPLCFFPFCCQETATTDVMHVRPLGQGVTVSFAGDAPWASLVSSYSSMSSNVISALNPTAVDPTQPLASSSLLPLPIAHTYFMEGVFLAKVHHGNPLSLQCPGSGYTPWVTEGRSCLPPVEQRFFSFLLDAEKLLATILRPLGKLRSNSFHRREQSWETRREMELSPWPHRNFYLPRLACCVLCDTEFPLARFELGFLVLADECPT